MILDTLALAVFKTGDAKQAAALEEKALDLARKAKATAEELDELKAALKKFTEDQGKKD